MSDLVQVAGAYALGCALMAILWRGSRRIFDAPAFGRRNYRDREVPVAAAAPVEPYKVTVIKKANSTTTETAQDKK